MEEKTLKLLSRQIKDIQAQADRVLGGDNSDEMIESFSYYAAELKAYITQHVSTPDILTFVNQLPEVNHRRSSFSILQYVLFPGWFYGLYKSYLARQRTVAEIALIRNKYASLEMMVKTIQR